MCRFDLTISSVKRVVEVAPEENSVDFIDSTSGGFLPNG